MPECEELIKNNYTDLIKNKTGVGISSYFSATKIEWIIKNIKGTKSLLKNNNLLCGTIDTWLIWNLTGGRSHVTDHTNASRTMIYNINTFNWDKELLTLFNIDKSILPKINNSASDFGKTTTEIFHKPIP